MGISGTESAGTALGGWLVSAAIAAAAFGRKR